MVKESNDSHNKNKLEQVVNFDTLIDMNTCLIENSKHLMKLQLDYLTVESPFVNMVMHFNRELMKSLEKEDVHQIKAVEDFLDKLSLIFKKGISRACKTINPMIALSIVDFTSNLLSSEAVFNVFGELVDKHLMRATIGSPSQLALVITLSCLAELPGALKKQLEAVQIPADLNREQINIQLQ